ncbi:hypothetical protein COCON_G00213770 [Conger conger]|uniref:Endonuclease/exonuclease/phosphatase domain-containing protein n=1 Tax=Conger conger TaxID=82655 RepID=A0A9Q1HNV3_CONCO|nr:hypothetical protein COCON_G00213770 [Conger conger]
MWPSMVTEPHQPLLPLTDPPDNFTVAGGLWNCQSATRKADFITGYASLLFLQFLALTETWITPENTATPAALSSSFSHTPRPSGRGGGTGLLISPSWKFCLPSLIYPYPPLNATLSQLLYIVVVYRPPGALGSFLDELHTLLSLFPEDGTPLILLGDFNIHLETSQSAAFLPLLHSFDLSLQHPPTTHKAGNLLDMIFLRNCSSSNPTVTPLHMSDHHFISASVPLSPPLFQSAVTSALCHPPHLPPESPLLSLLLNPSPNYPPIPHLPPCFPLSSTLDSLCPLVSRPA